MCSGLPKSMKVDYVQPSVGHYGVFNGRRFRSEIVPRVTDFIAEHNERRSADVVPFRREA